MMNWDSVARRYVEHDTMGQTTFGEIAPLAEGMVRKGGVNPPISRVVTRPAPPFPAAKSGWAGPGEDAAYAANDNVPSDQTAERKVWPWEIERRQGDWMQTYTGRKFWPLDPRAEEVHIEDIIHSLAMQCRYGSHCIRFYSVAEHSVHICRWLRDNGEDADTQLVGLLHDATEAYVSDVPRPLKRHLPGYKDAEDRAWLAVAARYDLPEEMPEVVHEADQRILADEIHQNMKAMDWHAKHDDPLGITLEFWDFARAKAEFWREFYRLQCERQELARTEMCAVEARHDRDASRADWEYQARKEAA